MKFKLITLQTAVAVSLTCVATASGASFLSDIFSSSSKEPVVLNESTETILKQGPIWTFNDGQTSSWTLKVGAKPKRSKAPAPYILSQSQGVTSLMGTQMDAGSVATTQAKITLKEPVTVSFQKNGTALLQYGVAKAPVNIGIKLTAYDVSGQKIANYIKNRQGKPTAWTEKAGSSTFPAGSVAYVATTTFINDEMVLPVNENFTSAKSSQELLKNFNKIPFCLKRVSGHAYGIMFDTADPKATSGTFSVTPVKRDTMFCTPTGEPKVASGNWNLIKTNKSHAVVLTMPSEVTPAEYGIEEHENVISKLAFIAPAKGDKIFRPGKFFAKGTSLESRSFLFNTTAVEALMKSVK